MSSSAHGKEQRTYHRIRTMPLSVIRASSISTSSPGCRTPASAEACTQQQPFQREEGGRDERERAAPSQTPPGSAPCSLQCTTSPAPACCSLPLADPLCLCGSDAPAAAVRRRRARALTGGGAGRGRHAEAGATCPCFTATLSAGALSGAPHMVAIRCPSYSPSSSALPLSAIHGGRQQRLAHRGWIIVDWLVCCSSFTIHFTQPHLLILPPSSCLLLQRVCNALMYHIEIALLCDMVAARGLRYARRV